MFRTLATVEIAGQPSRMLDVTASVVEQRMELVLPDGGGQMRKFDETSPARHNHNRRDGREGDTIR